MIFNLLIYSFRAMGRSAESAFALWATGHDLLKGTHAQDFHSLFLTFFASFNQY
jgi:hypothetical protein